MKKLKDAIADFGMNVILSIFSLLISPLWLIGACMMVAFKRSRKPKKGGE